MRVALISDVHANAAALSAVLSSAEDAEVDALIIAGDLIGYYFEPARVLQLLREWPTPIHIVRGNHEEMLLAASQSQDLLDQISLKYGPGISVAIDQLSSSEIAWITSLPHPLDLEISKCSILICHGSPNDINEYIYPDTPIANIIGSLPRSLKVLVMGHTHYPMVKKVGHFLIVNPGSVGQPRNRQPGAHWTLLDTVSMSVEHRVESYDISSLIAQCKLMAPKYPYLSQVLNRK